MASQERYEHSYIAEGLDAEDRMLTDAARAYAQDAIQVTGTPGLSVAIARKGQVIWQEAFGKANLAREAPMTIDSTWRVGSFSKTYVAIAVMQLVERGVLELHTPVRRYLPHLPIVNPLGERDVTVYDLVTYRSGLAMDTGDHELEPVALAPRLAAAYESQVRPEYRRGLARWTAKVGERYQYSTFGMATAGYLVEHTNPEALSFSNYVSRWITQPLGLSATTFPDSGGALPRALCARLCTGYARFGPVQIPTPPLYAATAPAMSLITTAEDQARLLLMFMGGGRLGDARLLEPATVRLMLTPQVEIGEFAGLSGWWNGIGLEMTDMSGPAFNYGHGGGQPWGWYSLSAAYPHLDLAVVALTNRWELPRWTNPASDTAAGLVIQFTANWLRGSSAARCRPRDGRSWAWRASYAIGFTMVERVNGLLGVSTLLENEAIERMASGAAVLPAHHSPAWDPDGFCAGAQAALSIESTPKAIRAFLDSGQGAITGADLPLLGLWFSGKPRFNVPMRFFAGPPSSDTVEAAPLPLDWAKDLTIE